MFKKVLDLALHFHTQKILEFHFNSLGQVLSHEVCFNLTTMAPLAKPPTKLKIVALKLVRVTDIKRDLCTHPSSLTRAVVIDCHLSYFFDNVPCDRKSYFFP